MSIQIDNLSSIVCSALSDAMDKQVRRQQVLDAMQGLTGDVRDLEMMVSHYKNQTAETSLNGAQSSNLAIQLRAVGASVAMQDAAMDMERRLVSIREHLQDLSMHLDL